MHFEDIDFHFQQSPTVRLIRSDHAALALGFFSFAFKRNNRLQVPLNELAILLEQYIDSLDERTKAPYTQPCKHYIDRWCDENHRFLKRFYESTSDEPVVELSYEAEQALELVAKLNQKHFVGTESRFYNLFSEMVTLAERSDTDPKVRVRTLKRQKKAIDREIKGIQETGVVERLNETQIREQFLNIFNDGRSLMADFRLVEDIFKKMAHEIKVRRLVSQTSKGKIVGEVLDSYDALELSDQGRSFDAFWNFLVDSEKQEQLKKVTRAILQIPEIVEMLEGGLHQEKLRFLSQFKSSMLRVGQKTLESKRRLSAELRKLLHQSNLNENRQVVDEINAIKSLAAKRSGQLHAFGANRSCFFALPYLPQIQLPLERPLWKPPETQQLRPEQLHTAQQELSTDQSGDLLRGEYIVDMAHLKQNIMTALSESHVVNLEDIVQRFPIEQGIAELLGYFNIATDSPGDHEISLEEKVDLLVTSGTVTMTLNTPQIYFRQRSVHARFQ